MKGDRMASADVALGAGKNSAFKVTPGAAGRTVALFIPNSGCCSGSRAGSTDWSAPISNFQGQYDDTLAEPKLAGTIKLGPYRMEKVTPRTDVGTLNSTIDGLNRAGNALQQFDKSRGQDRENRRSDRGGQCAYQRQVDRPHDGGLHRPGKRHGPSAWHCRAGLALNNLLSNVPLLGHC